MERIDKVQSEVDHEAERKDEIHNGILHCSQPKYHSHMFKKVKIGKIDPW